MHRPEVRVRSWVRGSNDDIASGLLGWLTIEYGSLLIDNITLRKTSAGRYALSFPSRTAKNGVRHAIVRPLGDAERMEIEREIFAQLGQHEEFVP